MNAVDLLVSQHRAMEAALDALVHGDPESRKATFGATADQLMAHVLVEEEHFYPAVRARRTEDILLESLEEHLSLKRVLADLLALRFDDPHFEPKLHVLAEQAEHHHGEEEEHLFPKVRKLLSEDELEALGEILEREEAALLRGHPRERARQQTEEAAALT